MLLKIVTFALMLFGMGNGLLSLDRVARVEIPGPFAVCGEGHFTHARCYDRWRGGCPSCHEEKANDSTIIVDSAFFPKNTEDACVFCLDAYDAKPERLSPEPVAVVPSAPPSSEPSFVSSPVWSKASAPRLPDDLAALSTGVLPEATVLAELYLDISRLGAGSITAFEARRQLLAWNEKRKQLSIRIRNDYLQAALRDAEKAALIEQAERDCMAKEILTRTIAVRHQQAFRVAIAATWPEMVTSGLPKRTDIVEVLNQKIRE